MATSPLTETFIYHSAHGDTNTKKGTFGDPYLVNPKAKNPVHPIKLPKGSVMDGLTIDRYFYYEEILPYHSLNIHGLNQVNHRDSFYQIDSKEYL